MDQIYLARLTVKKACSMAIANAKSLKTSDPEMLRILEEMLDRDQDITARAVARKHESISHASAITRSHHRSEMLADYKSRQAKLRAWRGRLQKDSRSKTASEMTSKDAQIAVLRRQVDLLKWALLATIRAVGELGGMTVWLKLFESYRGIREELKTMGALPEPVVKEIKPKA